jgi:hypothetical protein
MDLQQRLQNLEDTLAHQRLQNDELKTQLATKEDQDIKIKMLEQQLGELKFEKAELQSHLDEKVGAVGALDVSPSCQCTENEFFVHSSLAQRSYKTLKNFVIGKSDQIFAIITENGDMRANIQRLQVELAREQADSVEMHRSKRKLLSEQREQMLLMQEMHVSRLGRMGGDFIRLVLQVKTVILELIFRR